MNMRGLAASLVGGLALGGPAIAGEFATRAQAQDYLATALPRATAQNPKYTADNDGVVSRWLTDSVHFATGAAGAVHVTMRENYTQTSAGKTIPGRHEAAFSLADVEIADFAATHDRTPEGSPALGLLFTCVNPGCIAAVWTGEPSRADKTDIYIQDKATRARILAAFRRLQSE
jgi:hypothetical protein